MGIWPKLMPDEYVTSIYDIDLERLWAAGKRLILTDLDNTLVPWNHPHVSEPLRTWLEGAHARGFHVCIVSNNKSGRVVEFSRVSGIPAIGAAKKPGRAGFQQALARFERTPEETVMIGDQLFTDINGGNQLGLHTILVLPLHANEWWGTRVVRQFERLAFVLLRVRGLKKPDRLKKEGM